MRKDQKFWCQNGIRVCVCVSVRFEGQKDGECDAKKAAAPHAEQVAQVCCSGAGKWEHILRAQNSKIRSSSIVPLYGSTSVTLLEPE